MADLYLGILIVFLLSAVLFVLALRLGRKMPRRWPALMLMCCVLALLAFEKFVADKLWLAKWLPFSNVPVLGNFYPPLVALTAGLAWGLIPGGAARRSVLLVPLIGLSWVSNARLTFGATPELTSRWRRGVCLQTSPTSCSAAAAATLLLAYDIHSSEPEMADLCLTRAEDRWLQGGTTMLGLYRGLKLKAGPAGLTPVPFSGSVDDLRANLHGPVILTVELPLDYPDPGKFAVGGWQPGVRHSVVLYRFLADGRPDMGDPETGRERWSLEDLNVLWHGEGIRLVRKSAENGASK